MQTTVNWKFLGKKVITCFMRTSPDCFLFAFPFHFIFLFNFFNIIDTTKKKLQVDMLFVCQTWWACMPSCPPVQTMLNYLYISNKPIAHIHLSFHYSWEKRMISYCYHLHKQIGYMLTVEVISTSKLNLMIVYCFITFSRQSKSIENLF